LGETANRARGWPAVAIARTDQRRSRVRHQLRRLSAGAWDPRCSLAGQAAGRWRRDSTAARPTPITPSWRLRIMTVTRGRVAGVAGAAMVVVRCRRGVCSGGRLRALAGVGGTRGLAGLVVLVVQPGLASWPGRKMNGIIHH